MTQQPAGNDTSTGKDGGAPVVLSVAHSSRGRMRFKLADSHSRAALATLIDRIARMPDVTRVVARPNTRSVIVETDGDCDALVDYLVQDGVARILPHVPPLPLGVLARIGMGRIDEALGKRTEGMLDVRTAAASLLILLAILQLSRGRIAGPTTTLLMSAISLLDKGDRQ